MCGTVWATVPRLHRGVGTPAVAVSSPSGVPTHLGRRSARRPGAVPAVGVQGAPPPWSGRTVGTPARRCRFRRGRYPGGCCGADTRAFQCCPAARIRSGPTPRRGGVCRAALPDRSRSGGAGTTSPSSFRRPGGVGAGAAQSQSHRRVHPATGGGSAAAPSQCCCRRRRAHYRSDTVRGRTGPAPGRGGGGPRGGADRTTLNRAAPPGSPALAPADEVFTPARNDRHTPVSRSLTTLPPAANTENMRPGT